MNNCSLSQSWYIGGVGGVGCSRLSSYYVSDEKCDFSAFDKGFVGISMTRVSEKRSFQLGNDIRFTQLGSYGLSIGYFGLNSVARYSIGEKFKFEPFVGASFGIPVSYFQSSEFAAVPTKTLDIAISFGMGIAYFLGDRMYIRCFFQRDASLPYSAYVKTYSQTGGITEQGAKNRLSMIGLEIAFSIHKKTVN